MSNQIIKQENIGFLKSKMNLQQGTLVLSDQKLTLEAHKTGVGGFGLLGMLLKSRVEKSNSIFDLSFTQIQEIAQGKHGGNSNVLEVTDKQGNIYRIMVKNYSDWEMAIKEKM